MKPRLPGYTLLELLFAIVIFSALLGIIFSVVSTIRTSERFRDANARLTQAAAFGFEPMVRSIKQAEAPEEIRLENGSCVTVRGFYGESSSVKRTALEESEAIKIITVQAEKVFNPPSHPDAGTVYEWVRRVYEATPDGRFTETASKSVAPWPQPIENCGDTAWDSSTESTRDLIPGDVTVDHFKVRLQSPVLAGSNTSFTQSPFVTLELKLSPRTPQPRSFAIPVTVKTTVTPQFSFGAIHDEIL